MALNPFEKVFVSAMGYDPKTGKKIKRKKVTKPTAAEIAAMDKRYKARKAKGKGKK